MWIMFDEWTYKKNLKSLRFVLLVMEPLDVWQLDHHGCTHLTAPLMVWHPFTSPLSTFETCSHYFQQLFFFFFFGSGRPERHDRKSTQGGHISPLKERLSVNIICVDSSSRMKISEGQKSEKSSNMLRALGSLALYLKDACWLCETTWKTRCFKNASLLLDFTHIASFRDDKLRSKQVPSCINFSSIQVFPFAVGVQLPAVSRCSYSTIKKLDQCFTCLGEDAPLNKRREQRQEQEWVSPGSII